jgi:hypothetical protein
MNRKQKQQINLKKIEQQKEKYYNKLLEICEKQKIDFILETIDECCKNKNIPQYSNEYYLYYIFLVLTNVQTWTSLNVLFNERQIKPHINHYKTIQDKHLNWSNLNIYEKSYIKILKKNGLLDTKKI